MKQLASFRMVPSLALALLLVSGLAQSQSANYIPKFTGTGEVNSIMYQSANGIGVNNTNSLGAFYINGTRTFVGTQEGLSKIIPVFSGSATGGNAAQNSLMIVEPARGYGQSGDGISVSGSQNYYGSWTYLLELGNQAQWSIAGWMTGVNSALTVNTPRGGETHLFGVIGSVATTASQALGANDQVYGLKSSIAGTYTGNNSTQMAGLYVANTATSPNNTAGYFSATGGTNNYGIIVANGSVGIGTTTPRAKVVVSGAPNTNGGNGSVGSLEETFDNVASGSNTSYGGIAFASTPGYDFSVGKKTVNNSTYFQVRRQDGVELLTIDASGNTGIGTTTMGTAKLAVEGKVEAREVVVTSTNPFPDFVFSDDYKLMPLPELEKAIKLDKHLPGIPSAADVKKSGLNLGQTQVKLVEKVEELTLYLVALQKENDSLKKRVALLEH